MAGATLEGLAVDADATGLIDVPAVMARIKKSWHDYPESHYPDEVGMPAALVNSLEKELDTYYHCLSKEEILCEFAVYTRVFNVGRVAVEGHFGCPEGLMDQEQYHRKRLLNTELNFLITDVCLVKDALDWNSEVVKVRSHNAYFWYCGNGHLGGLVYDGRTMSCKAYGRFVTEGYWEDVFEGKGVKLFIPHAVLVSDRNQRSVVSKHWQHQAISLK